VQAKRHALAALRVQTGRTLIDTLTAKVADEDEWAWEDVVVQDIEREKSQKRKSQLPLPPALGQEYRLEDIRS
jgi:Ras GTPase-activating-like protein IQGAP2/3